MSFPVSCKLGWKVRSRMIGLLAATFAAGLAAQPTAAQRTVQENQDLRRMLEELKPSSRGIRPVTQPPASSQPTPAAATPATPAASAPSPTPPPAVAAAPPQAESSPPSTSITVRFRTGSAELSPEAERSLSTLGLALSSAELAPYRFRIEGHTDTVGGEEMNRALSERRAAAVREFLITRYNVAPSRLESVGLGESDLAVATPDQTPEARNRRVRVVNLDG